MDNKKLKIYTCSNVGMDYFIFLGRTIREAGFDVQPLYLTSEGNYRKLGRSKGVLKIWLRIKMYFLYPIYLIAKVLTSKRGSIFVVSSNTFFTPYLVHLLLKFKSGKVIHLLYDLYPDAIEVAGVINRKSFASRLIAKITKRNLAKSDATVFLGNFLQEHAENRWGLSPVSKVIDISTDLELYHSTFNSDGMDGKVILHYGGQLGHLHDAESLIACVKYVCESDLATQVEFNFYVSGAQAQFLQNSLAEYPIKIISAVPSSEWRNDIRNFHIGMVSLSPGGASVCIPNKTYGMMAGGMAILTVAPEWSDLANLVKSLDAGWVINNSAIRDGRGLKDGDYLYNLEQSIPVRLVAQAFYNQLTRILKNRGQLGEKRRNAFNGVRTSYGIKLLATKWGEVIEEVSR